MILEIDGLVIRSVKYGESDKLITVLTEKGKISFKARGIRSITSKNAAGCSAFVYSHFILDQKGEWNTLRKAQPLYTTLRAGASLPVLALASYFAELCEDVARDEETGKSVLRLLMNALYLLSKEDRHTDLIKGVFEMRLLAANGLSPSLSYCASCLKDTQELSAAFFRPTEGDLVCPDCLEFSETDFLRVSPETISLVRHSVESAEERAYAIRASEENLRDFNHFTERFLTAQLERGYKTLDFYRDVKKLSPETKENTKE